MAFFKDMIIIVPLLSFIVSTVYESSNFESLNFIAFFPTHFASGTSTIMSFSSLSISMLKLNFLFVSITIRNLSACSPTRRF